MPSNLFDSIEVDDNVMRFVNKSFDYADKIRAAMKRTKVPHSTLAIRVGVDDMKLARWLSGTHDWKMSQLLRVERALNVEETDNCILL